MIKRILVPVKATRGSEKAIAVACDMGQQLDASIHLINVNFIDMVDKDRITHQLMKETVNRCKDQDIVASYSIISAESEEDVPVIIAETAQEYDLIVMGHCRYMKIFKFLRDSVAESLIKLSPCPVVVAAAECEEDSRNQHPIGS